MHGDPGLVAGSPERDVPGIIDHRVEERVEGSGERWGSGSPVLTTVAKVLPLLVMTALVVPRNAAFVLLDATGPLKLLSIRPCRERRRRT
jgi:hypothetical protein